jgi:transglutaminase-like putative cysteine protease
MGFFRDFILGAALFAVSLQCTWAQDIRPVISKTWHLQYDVEKDGRSTQTFSSRNEIAQASALEAMKTFAFSFSTSIQRGEVLEAYTEKPGGRRIPVPTNNFQTTINKGSGDAAPVFSDQTSISVVFSDLSVGDIVGISYKVTDMEPIYPGQFSIVQTFSPYAMYEDAKLTIRAPTSLKLGIETHQLTEASVSEQDNMRTLQWQYQNLKPLHWDESDGGIWRIDEYPSVIASTFNSYEDIAAAYGARAIPKASPTQRLRELKNTIVGSELKRIEQARLLYEWVSKNITYGGNCIGIGAVVPRDLDVVLDNKMGDCKDHATLLQALLSAADIPSEQVLINSGGLYDLTKTPVVSMVNHVMNYLPEFKLYLDATAKDIPFGYLPLGSYGKPVIHVGHIPALAKTPDQQHTQSEQRVTMKLKIAKDGNATGEMQVALRGVQAASTRAYMRSLNQDSEKDFVKWALNPLGYKGKGVIRKGDTSGMSDTYGVSMDFEISNYLSGGATGAFILGPVVNTPIPIENFANIRERVEPKRRQTCIGFHSYENFDITLGPGVKLISLPPTLKVRSKILDFDAKYQRTKTGILVTREVHDKTPTSVCGLDAMAEIHKQATPIADNLKTQLLYQRQLN